MKPGMWLVTSLRYGIAEWIWPHEVWEISRTFQCVVDATSKRVELL